VITLKADNRQLLKNAKFSYLNNNYSSGITSIIVTSGLDFAADDYVLLGSFGSETAEIRKISNVATNTLTIDTTLFAHAESTKVTILKYNQVRFYNTATATFSATSPVDAYMDIQADNYLTYCYDSTNTTGFGWFVFYNETTSKATTNSNAIPYAGFAENSVKKIFDSFYSQLNNKELKLITDTDSFRWLNEGYSMMKNELNLVNEEYTVSDDTTITVVDGTKEYSLEDDFSNVMSIWNGTDDVEILPIDLENVSAWDSVSSNSVRYYLRGAYIGFSPTPAADINYTLRYKATAETVSSYYDNVELPDNNFYPLIDFMMFRASPKLNRGDGSNFFQLFRGSIEAMKVISHKRDNEKDSWDLDPTTNV